MTPDQDAWLGWLTGGRDGGNRAIRDWQHAELLNVRDQVLANSRICPADVVLDVGTGTGLVGLAALTQVGPAGRVIFCDISAGLLAACTRAAQLACPVASYSLLQSSAECLALADASVDVLTARSVVCHLADKRAAFTEFCRVLRPGGRLSIFEPIDRFRASQSASSPSAIDFTPVRDIAVKVARAMVHANPPPAPVFDERDLLTLTQASGFTEIRLAYCAETMIPLPAHLSWAALRNMAPTHATGAVSKVIDSVLTEGERASFDEFMTAQMGPGRLRHGTRAYAFLSASRPMGS